MKKLRFMKNWNKKLDCEYFTTIRKKSSYYKSGQDYQVLLNGKELGIANCFTCEDIDLSKISTIDLALDTGMGGADSHALFKKMYGNEVYKIPFVRLLLKWWST